MKSSFKHIACTMISMLLLATMVCAADTAPRVQYETNDVKLTAAAGMTITDGSFTVRDFRIASGQDPDEKNGVGQVHSLQNGVFSFESGRSASEEVAAWFNGKLSGYNDPSVTGDRTTFDQTAGKLNFAFIGDLDLTVRTEQYPDGLKVTFPNVAFAQGSTLFTNNWWFGQLTGQHTKDSDGAYTLLAIGKTASGEEVFASFLRGDNDVDTVSLEAICVAAPARCHPNKLGNAVSSFHSLPIEGTQHGLEGFPGSYDPSVNHIQGYAVYTAQNGMQYSVATHSVGTAPYAHIVAGPSAGNEKWGFKTYLQNWRHPGGVQIIGDYVLVPSEQEAAAHIALYDLRSLAVGELRRVETFDLAVDHKAGAVGITSYRDSNNQEFYIMIVAHLNGANTVYHVYTAPAENGIETAVFSEAGSFASTKDFQGFGLITEAETNRVYMVGLWSPSEGATFADYAYLYELNTSDWSVGPEIENVHLISSGALPGVMGVHFRYGAGVLVTEEGQLLLSATERNSVLGSTLMSNNWLSAA